MSQFARELESLLREARERASGSGQPKSSPAEKAAHDEGGLSPHPLWRGFHPPQHAPDKTGGRKASGKSSHQEPVSAHERVYCPQPPAQAGQKPQATIMAKKKKSPKKGKKPPLPY